MRWKVDYLPEVPGDFSKLDGSQQKYVRKSIKKTLQNPLSKDEGGYGIPLGHKGNVDLTNFLEIKLRGAGIRVIYKLVRTETEMLIIVIGMREDEDVFNIAGKRAERYNLRD